MKYILTKNLLPGYSMFGNKGAVWNDRVHITKDRLTTTLCGLPMLSSNHARLENIMTIGCPECINIYNLETAKK